MADRAARRTLAAMARFLLHQRHEAEDRGVVFASFLGHESTLRHGEVRIP
jgi:hypothetical protein